MNNFEGRRGFLSKFIPVKKIPAGQNKTEGDESILGHTPLARRDVLKSLMLAALIPSLASCKDRKDKQTETKLTPEDEKLLAEISNILRSFDFMNDDSPPKTRSALLALDKDIINKLNKFTLMQDIDARNTSYQALMFLCNSPDKLLKAKVLPIMMSGMKDPEANINAFCAFTCLGNGKKDAIPVLIEKLDQKFKGIIMPAEPALALPDYAYNGLIMYTNLTFPLEIKVWQKWWQENKDKLEWDSGKSLFVIKYEDK